MTHDEEQFLKRLMATFKVEAGEHLHNMGRLLQSLEQASEEGQAPPLVEALFREVHSLKGAARSVNLGEAENLCQALESLLAKLKQGVIVPGPPFYEVCYRAFDQVARDIEDGVAGKKGGDPDTRRRILQGLEQVGSGAKTAAPPEPVSRAVQRAQSAAAGPETAPADETVRISTQKLGHLLVQAEELSAFKFSSLHQAEELREIEKLVSEWAAASGRGTRAAAGAGRRGRAQADGFWESDEEESFAKTLSARLTLLARQTEFERRQLSTQLDGLMQDMKQALMLPFSTLLDVAPKLVRDLARDSGKEVELAVQGAAIEIDRRILEQIKAPLVHLLRNAVDHGIEAPVARKIARKPARGRIALDIAPKDGNKIELSVADDGAGLDLAQIKAQALKAGVMAADALARLDRKQAMDLIFESGLSTSALLTDVSGRGLGLAIVREKVEKLGGTVEVEDNQPCGTRFRIVLPATLATFRGLLVGVHGRDFVLPSINVERVARVPREAIRTVENRETIELDGIAYSLVSLADTLRLNGTGLGAIAAGTERYCQVVMLASGGKRIAFAVDEIVGDQEVLVKKLGPQLLRTQNIAGVTVLERGRLAPILNVQDLLKSALKVKSREIAAVAEKPEQAILVVEDSITSRSLIRGILESAGYRVDVAVDGLDGLTTLRTGRYDLVVSDVEMPRMDGFELTAKIRAEGRFGELPVILVTALDTREHKERGIEVGANAYIVKSSFDQSNLLDAVRRLI